MRALLLTALLFGCHHEEPAAPHQDKDEHYGATIEDEEAWKLAHPERCSAPVRPSDCTGVREYLADFPSGKHAGEAKNMLSALEGKLAGVPDDKRWDAADAVECKVADDIEACDDVAHYLKQMPMGKHAAEARALIDAAKPKIEKLRAELDAAGVEIEILGTDHTGKDCPPILGDTEHHALCVVLDVRVRKPIKQTALGVMTNCGEPAGKPKKLYWATGQDLTKVAIGASTDLHVAVPRSPRCTIEVGIGRIPKLEREGLRRLCLYGKDDPKDDHAEPGSCPDLPAPSASKN